MNLAPILVSGFTIESIKVPDINYETDLYNGEAEDGIYYLIYDVTADAERISSFILKKALPIGENTETLRMSPRWNNRLTGGLGNEL